MTINETPLATLTEAAKIAREHLKYVYIGNVGGNAVNTYCPSCGFLLLDRVNFKNNLTNERKCPQCGLEIKIVGDAGY
jgi:pyruvate formate lyase activating enzyme